jgi:hypothetical protein
MSSGASYQLTRSFFGDNITSDISFVEYQTLIRAKQCIIRALSLEEAFDVLVQNYMEFEKEVLRLTIDYMVLHPEKYGFHQEGRRLLNRRIMNVLTTARAYLDQLPGSINDVSGNENAYSDNLKAFVSLQYDTRFGYRVMEALRNYAQHCGFPIHGMGFSMHNLRDEALQEFSVTPSIASNDLREDKDFKRAVLKELQERGDSEDIRPLLRDYVSGLGKIQNEYRKLTGGLIASAELSILNALDEFHADHSLEGQKWVDAAKIAADGRLIDRDHLFPDFVNYRRELAERNGGLERLESRYATSREKRR